MPSLADRQHAFAGAILDSLASLPAGLQVPAGSAPAERFQVYRNNVAVGLVEALHSSFPVVNRLVGDEFFSAMARIHAFQSPPETPVLLAYGGNFPDFVASFEPAASLPYLADVARLEWHWLEAYHSAEAAPLAMEDLGAVPRQQWPRLRLALHPSARLLDLDLSALTIWRLHQGDEEPDTLELQDARERVLLVRPAASVSVIELSPGGFAFLKRLQQAGSIADAVTAALEVDPGIDLKAALVSLLAEGVFAAPDGGGTHP